MMNPTTTRRLDREGSIGRIVERTEPWDLVVIGGGATGIAIALDATHRGMSVVLFEQADFGKGTSSRSTKLVHGGVRYLRQGNITLVRDALRERSLLLENAPHLVHDLQFLIPCHGRWEKFYYAVGLWLYDFLATRSRFGKSRRVSAAEAKRLVPTLNQGIGPGGVVYHDGQFDDAGLLISMARTAAGNGACLVNYVTVESFEKDASGKLTHAKVRDHESGNVHQVAAKCFINAAGPFCDAVRTLDDATTQPMLAVSQGVHIVLPSRFLPGETAIIVPKTSDGRVIFIIPWHGYTLVGTTDTPIEHATLEPTARIEEIDFLLETSSRYLSTPATRKDVTSVFAGIRPLVKGDPSARTASLSRDHVIRVSPSGLVTITGGKWTTVRKMAEDCVDRAAKEFGIAAGPCGTQTLSLESISGDGQQPPWDHDAAIGGESSMIAGTDICERDVIRLVRETMARKVEDVLARRSRLLFCDAGLAIRIAPRVAEWMAKELGRDSDWVEQQVASFADIASRYRVSC